MRRELLVSQVRSAEQRIVDQPGAWNRNADSPNRVRVGVVVAVRNDAQRLDVCLASLQASDYPSELWRLIVVDNGSHDDSAEVARRHGAQVLSAPGIKVGAVRNQGVAAADDCEVIAFVDSDNELPADWLAQGVKTLLTHPQAAAVGAFCLPPEPGTWVQTAWAWHRLRRHRPGPTPWLGAGNLFVRRAAFVAVGGFDPTLTACEDVDLCERLRAAGGEVLLEPRIRNIHHGEPATLGAFLRKECWRGSSGVRAFLAHGMPRHEWPSLAFPLWHLLAAIGLIAGLAAWAVGQSWWWPAVAAVPLVLPSLLLAMHTASYQVRLDAAADDPAHRPSTWELLGRVPRLMILYLTYALARVLSLFS